MAHEQQANLSEYPAHGAEVSAWKEGMQMARQMARSVGMAPQEPFGGGEDSDRDSNDDGGDNYSDKLRGSNCRESQHDSGQGGLTHQR